MEVAEWVQGCRKKLGWTQDKAAEELKVSKATISSWETGKYLPKIQAIMQLAAYSEEKLPSSLSYQEANFYATESAKISFFDNSLNETDVSIVVDILMKDCFAWKIADKSLETVFIEGDTLVIDPHSQPKPADYVLIRHEGYLTVRKFKIISIEGSHYEFVPENGLFPVLDNTRNKIEIIGVAKESRRRL